LIYSRKGRRGEGAAENCETVTSCGFFKKYKETIWAVAVFETPEKETERAHNNEEE